MNLNVPNITYKISQMLVGWFPCLYRLFSLAWALCSSLVPSGPRCVSARSDRLNKQTNKIRCVGLPCVKRGFLNDTNCPWTIWTNCLFSLLVPNNFTLPHSELRINYTGNKANLFYPEYSRKSHMTVAINPSVLASSRKTNNFILYNFTSQNVVEVLGREPSVGVQLIQQICIHKKSPILMQNIIHVFFLRMSGFFFSNFLFFFPHCGWNSKYLIKTWENTRVFFFFFFFFFFDTLPTKFLIYWTIKGTLFEFSKWNLIQLETQEASRRFLFQTSRVKLSNNC